MRFKTDDSQQRTDNYSIIKGLEPDFGGKLLSGPAFLEAIPPPVTPCIQLHRLKKGQNLAHLFLLYQHYRAKAVILANTEDDYILLQELLSTISVTREGPANVNCVLVSKDVGKVLITSISCVQGVTCEISPYSHENEPPSAPFQPNKKPEKG